MIAHNPLLAYTSALIFSPSNSIIRKLFQIEEPKWLKVKPKVDYNWTFCLQTLSGHSDTVKCVAFSEKGYLASGSSDGTIKIWNTTTGREWFTINIGCTAHSIVLSPDGQYLAAICGTTTAKIWDLLAGKEQQAFRGKEQQASRGKERTKGYDPWFTSVAFSKDGRYLALGSVDGALKIWDVILSREKQTLEGHTHAINSIAFSTHHHLASGSDDETIRIWDITGKRHQTLKGHGWPVASVVFSTDDRYLASVSTDYTIKIWDAIAGKEKRTIKLGMLGATSMAFSADGRYFAVARMKTIKIWHLKTGKEHQTLRGRSCFYSVAFSANGSYLASGQEDNLIDIWEVSEGKDHRPSNNDAINSVALSTDGNYLASGGDDCVIRIWDTKTGEERQTLKGHNATIASVAFSADSRYLASAAFDLTIKIWNSVTGEMQRSIVIPSISIDSSFVFSMDGCQLAWSSMDDFLIIWDVNTGEVYQKIEKYGKHHNLLTFSADGRYLASAADGTSPRLIENDDTTISIWDVGTQKEWRILQGHSNGITSIAFSPDNRHLASASIDGNIKVWDTKTGNTLQTIKKETLVRTISFDFTASYLRTETESIRLNMGHLSTVAPQILSPTANSTKDQRENRLIADNTQDKNDAGYALSLDACWITWNGHGILWLPPEYRSLKTIVWPPSGTKSSQLLTADVLIANASGSGKLVIMRMAGSGPYSML